MLDFRKVLLALSVAGLGLVGTASAQVPQCTPAAAPFEGYVAVEGTTEQLPQIVITCTGTGTFTGPAVFTLTGSVPFTNQTVVASPHNVDLAVTDSAADPVTSITQPGPTTIQITFNTVTAGVTTFTVAGLRVNASLAPVASTVTVAVASTSVQMAAASTVNEAFVAKTIGALTIVGNANQVSCGLLPATLISTTAVTLTNGFADALKQLSDVTNNPNYAADANSIAALQGTRFAVTFSNLNVAGVNYYVPQTVTNGALTLTAYAAATGNTAAALTGGTGPGAALVPLTVTSTGTATIYFGVTADSPTASESASIQLSSAVPSLTAVTSYSTTAPAVSVTLVGPASPAYPGYSASQTAYAATQTASAANSGLLLPCATTLLFPYVVNSDGFDTGIAIANASTGIPAGSSLIPTPTSGACVVTFYGTGAATASVVYNTGTIPTATDASFLASVEAPGITGYAVAVCNFVGAHGYAFITDGFGGGGRGLSADYLAVVLADGNNVPPLATF